MVGVAAAAVPGATLAGVVGGGERVAMAAATEERVPSALLGAGPERTALPPVFAGTVPRAPPGDVGSLLVPPVGGGTTPSEVGNAFEGNALVTRAPDEATAVVLPPATGSGALPRDCEAPCSSQKDWKWTATSCCPRGVATSRWAAQRVREDSSAQMEVALLQGKT